jgi:hypothetical protein
MGQVKAIETRYKGYRFRSRLEARWAVFFDALGICYRYEVEGFNLGDVAYLPDFWLPHPVSGLAAKGWGLWAEIKPESVSETDLTKSVRLAEGTRHNALVFQGDPWPDAYEVLKVSAVCLPATVQRGLAFQCDGTGYIHLRNQTFRSHPCSYRGDLSAAYRAARGARFEHGEAP